MVEENISQEFKLKKINGIRNFFIKEIKQKKKIMNKKHKNISTTLNYMEHFKHFTLYYYWMWFNIFFAS